MSDTASDFQFLKNNCSHGLTAQRLLSDSSGNLPLMDFGYKVNQYSYHQLCFKINVYSNAIFSYSDKYCNTNTLSIVN